MSDNFTAFAMGLDAFGEEVEREATKTHRAATLEGFTRLVKISPVDKGTFRANWQIGTSIVPPGNVIDFVGGGARSANASAAQSLALARELPKVAQIKPFSVSWIANNLPYGPRLNDGHSTQAPANFVERTAATLKERYGG